ncbi:thioredoxin-disulfide reductase [Mycoplasma sp. T363T]|uniref:Thioredoxin reductase n=1 Tax=Mycoplasma bradburyae TaxID=2963128 RepID=A0AAW6HS26_9MOLU|nr:thioredoxin-disulfide reductase [Mycoplasma bradburyae]MDC4163479.1 thioredoxin-disulfide reductase [Mycoplasma bradburyae]MDC4182081.1 thioredoxin-disulfide reductase [Mycoplasma bradburyae]MDC4183528.1 thioredoxin-disulfide reductase [Mycoplasma bradburyae]UTS69845.1 thioredoxin-disulfide reductase [Mycoplasma bradburyae]
MSYRVDGKNDLFDLVIIGSGPAGITAGIYAKRANINVCVVEGSAPGGKILKTGFIDNYPGYESIKGPDLAVNMFTHLSNLSVPFFYSRVSGVDKQEDYFFTYLDNGTTLISKAVIVATGTTEKKLGLENEAKFESKGISYCAICDGPLYKNRDVAVIGGGNGAIEEALYLSGICNKVYLIHRRDEFRADMYAVNKLKEKANVSFLLSSVADGYIGDQVLKGLKVKDLKTNEVKEIAIDCLFPYIGAIPNAGFLKSFNVLNEEGYVIVDQNQKTAVDGLYAAGDCVNKKIRQISTAVSDGTIAALAVNDFLKLHK